MGTGLWLRAFDAGTVKAGREACEGWGKDKERDGGGDATASASSSSSSSCEDILFGWLTMRTSQGKSSLTPSEVLSVLLSNGIDALVPEAGLCTPDSSSGAPLLEAMRSADVPVFVWWIGEGTDSVESVEARRTMAEGCVDGFIVANVGEARAAIRMEGREGTEYNYCARDKSADVNSIR